MIYSPNDLFPHYTHTLTQSRQSKHTGSQWGQSLEEMFPKRLVKMLEYSGQLLTPMSSAQCLKPTHIHTPQWWWLLVSLIYSVVCN